MDQGNETRDKHQMEKRLPTHPLVRHPSKVKTETRNQNVWLGDIEILELELELEPEADKNDCDPYNSAC